MTPAVIDTTVLRWKLNELHEVMIGKGMDVANFMADETRFLSMLIAAFIPPVGKGLSAKQTGERAIERELSNLATEAAPSLMEEVESRYGHSDISTAYITEKSGTRLNLQWDNLDDTGGNLPDLHQQYRDRQGKIPFVKSPSGTWKSRVVVPIGTRGPYIQKVQQKVGRWKSAWAFMAYKLGGNRIPAWISRHFGSVPATAQVKMDPQNPLFIFGSSTPGNSRMRKDIADAVTKRARIIDRKIRRLISGHAQDLNRGTKPQPKHGKFKEGEPSLE